MAFFSFFWGILISLYGPHTSMYLMRTGYARTLPVLLVTFDNWQREPFWCYSIRSAVRFLQTYGFSCSAVVSQPLTNNHLFAPLLWCFSAKHARIPFFFLLLLLSLLLYYYFNFSFVFGYSGH